jgi:hypothetical protein
MNITKNILGLAAIVAPLLSSQSLAEITGSLTAGYSTNYEFRGAFLGDDLIETNLTAATELNGFNFTASAWRGSSRNSLFNGATGDPHLEELDLSLAVSKQFGKITTSLGTIHYNYDGNAELNTTEVYGSVSSELFAGITGTVTVYYDVDTFDGWFAYADLGRSFKFNDSLSLALNGGLGVYESYTATDNGVNHFYLKAALPWAATKNLTITPYVKYITTTGDYESDFTMDDSDLGGDQVSAGVNASIAF